MGLGPPQIEALVREHKYRPIEGDVVLVGRQTVYFTPEGILSLLAEHGITTRGVAPEEIEIDHSTQSRRGGYEGQNLITDSAFFRLLGVKRTLALDQSPYEGAEIVHDLSRPIPEYLKNSADFIVDGSTLDNVFNPALALVNLVQLLRPRGRILSSNVFSNHAAPYTILTPLWFFDYFVMNKFLDCKLYILVYVKRPETNKSPGRNVFCINLDYLQRSDPLVSAFASPHVMGTVLVAEKGEDSTCDVFPVQQHYRSAADWISYKGNLASIQNSKRHHLVRSTDDITFFDVAGGHLFVAKDFTERDPMTEIQRGTALRQT